MLVQYVSPPMSTLTQKNVKIPKLLYWPFFNKKMQIFNARKKSRQTRALINAKKNAHNFSKKNSTKNFIAKKDKKNAPIFFLKSTI